MTDELRENQEKIAIDANFPFVLFSVGKNIYGVNSRYVLSIECLGEVTEVPNGPQELRGTTFFRGSFIPVLDIRRMFGMATQKEEFDRDVNVNQRIIDHENWVNTLEKSILDQTEFTLADDPRKCAFGKWLYSYETSNNVVGSLLAKIEKPHGAVHETAKVVRNLMKEGKEQEALTAAQKCRGKHVAETIHLLKQLESDYMESLHEILLVLEGAQGVRGLLVDAIVSVEYLSEELPTPSKDGSRYIRCLGKRKKDGSVISLIDIDQFT